MLNTVEVYTEQGKICGNLSEDGSRNFKGIPYAVSYTHLTLPTIYSV